MSRALRAEVGRLLQRLAADPAFRLVAGDSGSFHLQLHAADDRAGDPARAPEREVRRLKRGGADGGIPAKLVAALTGSGLLREAEPGRFAAAPEAEAWLKRQRDPALGFHAQHHAIGLEAVAGEPGRAVLTNLEESAIAALARRPGKGGAPWLQAHAVTAAERLRRDFEIGQLQPRITSSWSATVSTGRRAGDCGAANLTEAALAARLRFERAMDAVGPEFAGLLADICCFLKGLETVERERQWPARSAKLVLRLALDALARHFGLTSAATGKAAAGLRHWGAEDYRPQIG